MMEKYVVSRELAERLKAAGFPQLDNQYAWSVQSKYVLNMELREAVDGWFAAPLSDELLEKLPAIIREYNPNKLLVVAKQESGSYWVAYDDTANHGFFSDKPADALAGLWLWCKEQGYIDTTKYEFTRQWLTEADIKKQIDKVEE